MFERASRVSAWAGKVMRFGSIFSGIGGFDLGFEQAGLSCSWQVEIDSDCDRVLSKQWPNVIRHKDVRDAKAMQQMRGDETANGIPSSAVGEAGPSFLVQTVRERAHEGKPQAQLQARATKAVAIRDSIQNHSRASGQDDRSAKRPLRNLRETDEAPLRGPLPSDEQGAGHTVPSLQSEIGDSRGSGVCESSTKVLTPVDVVCAGFPCQDLSVAGKRAGLDGSRSSLFYDVIRIIREMRKQTNGRSPTFLVLENVPGIFSSNGGRDFAVVLREVAESGAMDIAWAVLDAQWFGVAQRRRRMFLVADFRGERAAEILSIPYSLQGNPPTRREAGAGVASAVRRSAKNGGEWWNGNQIADALTVNSNQQNMPDKDNFAAVLAPTVTSKWAKHSGGPSGSETNNLVAHALRSEGADASEDGTGRGTPLVVAEAVDVRNLRMQPDGTSGTLQHKKSGGYSLNYQNPVMAFRACGQDGFTPSDEITPPIASTDGGGANAPTIAFTERTRTEGRTFEAQRAPARARI